MTRWCCSAKPWQMAFANTERNKKKTVLVFISLALSMVILNAVSLFVGGFDSEKWLDATTSSDFLVAKYPYFQFRGAWTDSITEEDIRYLQDNVEIQDGGAAYEATEGVYSLMEVGDDEYDEYQEIHEYPVLHPREVVHDGEHEEQEQYEYREGIPFVVFQRVLRSEEP